jgi:hypothetical protein
MQGDSKKAIEFLKKVQPHGLWALTAIALDRKALSTETFSPSEEVACLAWIERYNGKRNIYWHVNPVRHMVRKKAEREDIKEVIQLHVDIDPRAGESLEEERPRILKQIEEPPLGIPRPTTVIFSGGGYQAFWKLREPIPINGELSAAEDAKLYNMHIERAFVADNCHNIDRLMRLVGTVNIPDAKKKKKGRVETVAELVWHDEKLVYDISEFPKAVQVQMTGEGGGFSSAAKTVEVSGNVQRITDVDELNEWNVPERVKVIIVQGNDPDNPKADDNSRSSWLFDCICQLVRADVPDDIIFGIITDKDFKIAESVLEMNNNAEKYAIRQIERAKEWVIEPQLRELNERHAVISTIGGKCRIIEEVMDHALGRPQLARQSFEDFRNRYSNKKVQVGIDEKTGFPIKVALGKWWINHPLRRQYETIVFAPNREIPDAYNLWKGYACDAIEGDCSLFLNHVKNNVCSGNEEYYTYVLGWMARCVQQPDSPGQVALVMRGGMGTGKSFFAKQFGSLFGRHFMQVADPKHLVGSFNAHLRDCVVLFGDEAFFAGDKKHESTLRTLITEETITIEAKGINAENSPNYMHVILASNKSWIVPAGADERRFFVLDVGSAEKQNTSYFRKIAAQMNEGGREALLYYLQNYPLADFEVRNVPKTEALHEQKLLSLTPEEEWWYNKLMEGAIFKNSDDWEKEVVKEAVFDDYVDYMRQANTMRRANKTTLARFLFKVNPETKQFRRNQIVQVPTNDGFFREVNKRVRFYSLPDLKTARENWEKIFGKNVWPEIVTEQAELDMDNAPPF